MTLFFWRPLPVIPPLRPFLSWYDRNMIESDFSTRLDTLEAKVDKIYISTEKTRKYFLWTLIAALVVTVLPLVGLIFVIPKFLETLAPFSGAW